MGAHQGIVFECDSISCSTYTITETDPFYQGTNVLLQTMPVGWYATLSQGEDPAVVGLHLVACSLKCHENIAARLYVKALRETVTGPEEGPGG